MHTCTESGTARRVARVAQSRRYCASAIDSAERGWSVECLCARLAPTAGTRAGKTHGPIRAAQEAIRGLKRRRRDAATIDDNFRPSSSFPCGVGSESRPQSVLQTPVCTNSSFLAERACRDTLLAHPPMLSSLSPPRPALQLLTPESFFLARRQSPLLRP